MADEPVPQPETAAPAAEPVAEAAPVEAAPDPTPPLPEAGPTVTTSPAEPAPTSGDPAPVAPVRIDQTTKRSDADPLEGSFVKVIDGEHAGQIAAFIKAIEHDPDTGYPATILVRFRDPSHTHEYAVVDLGQVAQASQTGLVT